MAYIILRKLEGGELLRIASFDDLSEAQRLAEALHKYWPADYSVIALDGAGLKRYESLHEWRPQRAARRRLN
jgi:hypothetical protein